MTVMVGMVLEVGPEAEVMGANVKAGAWVVTGADGFVKMLDVLGKAISTLVEGEVEGIGLNRVGAIGAGAGGALVIGGCVIGGLANEKPDPEENADFCCSIEDSAGKDEVDILGGCAGVAIDGVAEGREVVDAGGAVRSGGGAALGGAGKENDAGTFSLVFVADFSSGLIVAAIFAVLAEENPGIGVVVGVIEGLT